MEDNILFKVDIVYGVSHVLGVSTLPLFYPHKYIYYKTMLSQPR